MHLEARPQTGQQHIYKVTGAGEGSGPGSGSSEEKTPRQFRAGCEDVGQFYKSEL